MITIEKLKEYGADVEVGLKRCVNNENLYLRLVGMLPDNENFEIIKEAAVSNDIDRLFDAAHALKGAVANLSITPIYDKVSEITELSRAKTEAPYVELSDELLKMRDEFKAMM